MRRPDRLGLVHGALLLVALATVGRAAQVQLWEGSAWRARADRQQLSSAQIPAARGRILDATGATLAESRQLVSLSVAPGEVRKRTALARALTAAGVPREWVNRSLDRKRAWVTIPGRFLPTDVAPAIALRGVYAEPVVERVYTPSEATRRIVGRIGFDGAPLDGLELSLDSLLKGVAGKATMLRDARGRRFESPTAPGTPSKPGHTVVLTINHELQGIAERALEDAVAKMGADGGDIIMMNPHSGELLAMASRRTRHDSAGGSATAATALTEPFEPGSTLKPFIAAAVLGRGRTTPDEVIETYDGKLELHGRLIEDEHKAPRMTVRDVIVHSSNIGIAQLAERLSPREEYETLRDLGFGAPTGLPVASEAAGTLRHPKAWSSQSAASLAMGYEIAITPVQLAVAYAALANGGELVEPSLIKEIRTADGDVRYRHSRRVVRRVMSEEVAEEVRRMLARAVEEGGTAVKAGLASFAVAGKTGTARRFLVGRRGYADGQYVASFVGLFPSDKPQYVILVKIDNPDGNYFGGQTAAPVSRSVLQAALAARNAALDRTALTSEGREIAQAQPEEIEEQATPGSVPMVVSLEAGKDVRPGKRAVRRVPDVRNLPLRSAVTSLHRAGFRVQLTSGPKGLTVPAAGTVLPAGATVRVNRGK
jgi:cell division protein FtsI (penicillin-binding protein 3)